MAWKTINGCVSLGGCHCVNESFESQMCVCVCVCVCVCSYLLLFVKCYSKYIFKLNNMHSVKWWPKLVYVILTEEMVGGGSYFWYILQKIHFWCVLYSVKAYFCHCCLVVKSYPTLCHPIDCSPPDSSAHGIFQARILEWVAISSPGDLTHSGIIHASPALIGGFFTTEPPGKPPKHIKTW